MILLKGFSILQSRLLVLSENFRDHLSIRLSLTSYQLCKSATSSGANYEEALAGSSKQDFIYKTEISLREMKESNYWLRIIKAIEEKGVLSRNSIDELINESSQLSKILASIIINAKKDREGSK